MDMMTIIDFITKGKSFFDYLLALCMFTKREGIKTMQNLQFLKAIILLPNRISKIVCKEEL